MKREAGFTLMETLLAISLFMIVMIAVYNVTSLGLQIWKRSRQSASAERKAILAIEKMGHEFRSALFYAKPDKQKAFSDLNAQVIDYQGSESSISFPAALDSFDYTAGGMGGNGRITYQWDRASGSICRRVESVSDIYSRTEKKCVPIISNITKVSLRYWLISGITKSHSWYDNWDGEEGLPEAVEIRFALKTEKNPLPREYQRIFIIPAGGER